MKQEVRFITYAGSLWINRQSLLTWIKNEIEIAESDSIPGLDDKRQYGKTAGLKFLADQLVKLNPETAEVLS